MPTAGPLHPDLVLPPGWAPRSPGHVPGSHTRGGNAMGRTRAGLLDGAARAFADKGLRRSTMQSVAAAAGVAKGTLYNHFRTKDEVARALLAAELDRVAALAAGLGPAAALTALADAVATHPVLRRLSHDEPAVLTRLLTAPGGWADVVGRLAAAMAVDTGTAEVVGRWLLGLVLQPGDPLSRRRAAARLASLLAPA